MTWILWVLAVIGGVGIATGAVALLVHVVKERRKALIRDAVKATLKELVEKGVVNSSYYEGISPIVSGKDWYDVRDRVLYPELKTTKKEKSK